MLFNSPRELESSVQDIRYIDQRHADEDAEELLFLPIGASVERIRESVLRGTVTVIIHPQSMDDFVNGEKVGKSGKEIELKKKNFDLLPPERRKRIQDILKISRKIDLERAEIVLGWIEKLKRGQAIEGKVRYRKNDSVEDLEMLVRAVNNLYFKKDEETEIENEQYEEFIRMAAIAIMKKCDVPGGEEPKSENVPTEIRKTEEDVEDAEDVKGAEDEEGWDRIRHEEPVVGEPNEVFFLEGDDVSVVVDDEDTPSILPEAKSPPPIPWSGIPDETPVGRLVEVIFLGRDDFEEIPENDWDWDHSDEDKRTIVYLKEDDLVQIQPEIPSPKKIQEPAIMPKGEKVSHNGTDFDVPY
ncbi:MAG: hypothetical protein AAB551_04275 [Patescibacteria group bacterium]